MDYRLYTLDNEFIRETNKFPLGFTGIIKWVDGSKFWLIEGKAHRTDGPACEYSNGRKEWYVDNKRHRRDGPAIVWEDGIKYWYVDGKEVTELQCRLLYDIMKLKGLL